MWFYCLSHKQCHTSAKIVSTHEEVQTSCHYRTGVIPLRPALEPPRPSPGGCWRAWHLGWSEGLTAARRTGQWREDPTSWLGTSCHRSQCHGLALLARALWGKRGKSRVSWGGKVSSISFGGVARLI